ncbi:Pup--protein ligase [Trueperella bialowiezensis]|uniref:Pup--protein ligase n=1 Tax=Trueperella bialowiezensis TaxID=312285 RepID=A0A3S4V982_9ACTO|nr:Pup--protein ligase [Trueperella bialowiezensis]VEI12380.1 Pup--protein ligase [Trueperella bialowiezensis]
MIPRRILGVETEYGVLCASETDGQPLVDAEEAAHALFEPLLQRTRSTNAFLPNGARLYLDVGAHPEYATAECDDLGDLLANDRAGDALYADMAAQVDEQFPGGKLHLFKNNLDSYGNSYGSHENYLVRRRRDFRARIDSLIPFFVTRQIMVGAGFVEVTDDGPRYKISQRADIMDDAVSAATTRSRPMINTRDEPHGDAELYRRMHVIVGDSTMSDSTTALKIGSTEALINVIESGRRMTVRELADPVEAIREVSVDTTGRALVTLKDGSTMSALEIQREVYEFVVTHYEEEGWLAELDPIRRYVFDLWGRTLDALEQSAPERVATEIDWIAKWRLLGRYADKLGVNLADPRIARLDLAWHDITDAGLRPALERSGGLKKLMSAERIEEAKGIPPQTTRAKVRGDFVALAMENRRDFMVDWMNIRLLDDDGARHFTLKDPFAAADAQIDELMEHMDRA